MRIHTLNENDFEKIDTHDKAWIFGWIASDGCIIEKNKKPAGVQFGLKETDKNILEKIKQILNYGGQVKFYDNTLQRVKYKSQGWGNAKDQWRLAMHSQKLANDLVKLGMEPRKSMTMEWITVPEEYMNSYLQGFFEGDGSIYLIKHPSATRDYIGINFTGTQAYLEGLKKYLGDNVLYKDLGYIRSLKIKAGTYYQLVYSGDQTIKTLMDYFYKDCPEDRRLHRKYDLFQGYLESLINPTTSTHNIHVHKNKSTDCHMITAFGYTKSLTEWSEWEYCVCSRQSLYHRIVVMELDPEYAITTEKLLNLPPSTAKLNPDLADQIRILKEESELNNLELAEQFGVSSDTISSILQNHAWVDDTYIPTKTTLEKTILIEYKGRTQTLTEWSKITGIPKETLDRRYRQGLTLDQVFHNENKRLNLGKTKSSKDIKAIEVAYKVRTAYKNGIIGKANYESEDIMIPKSRYMDLILNRTCKEGIIWWK